MSSRSPSFIKNKVQKPSYMAIKKALAGRQPKLFYFDSSIESLLQQESLLLVSLSGIFNKVPSFTHFGCFKVVLHMWSSDSACYCLVHKF